MKTRVFYKSRVVGQNLNGGEVIEVTEGVRITPEGDTRVTPEGDRRVATN